MEITLDKKQIQVISLFELKIDCKAMETTHNINNAFGPGTVNEHTLQRWLKKFCKGGKSLDGEEHSGWLSEVDDAQFRGSSKLILLQLHKKLPKNSTSTSLQLFGIWSKLERWKSSRSRYLMSWPQKKKKKVILKCHLLLFFTITMISQLDCDMQWKRDFIPQPAMTSSVAGQRRSSKALPKAKLVPKKGHGHCSVVCGPSDPPQLSEFQRNHYIWDVCSVSWWDAPKTARPRAGIDQEFSSVA